MIRRATGLFALALVALIGACATKDPTNPGTVIGTFHVTANLTKTTCGQPPNPWVFDVKINHDGTTVYWIQGGFPIAGDSDLTAQTTMTSSFTDEVRPADDTKKLAACDITRNDSLHMLMSDATAKPAVDPGTATSFIGTLQYAFVPTSDSSCGDQLTSAGGGYDALPCEVDYDLSGALTSTASN